jgi:hypothetical protein
LQTVSARRRIDVKKQIDRHFDSASTGLQSSVPEPYSPSEKQQLSGRAFAHLPNHQKQMAQMMRFI